MAITISGENNNDRILAQDGVIDQISGINIVGLITASHINVGSNIQLGNAGIITATTFVGNVTGNVNSTSPLLLQTGGSERFRITSDNALGIAGANYGSSGQVLTSGGSGSAVSWTTPTVTTISGNANNRIITGSGTANTLNGESTFTYDGDGLLSMTSTSGSAEFTIVGPSNTDSGIYFNDGANDGAISYDHSNRQLKFRAGGHTRMYFAGGNDSNNNVIYLVNNSYDDGILQYYNGGIYLKTGSSNGDRVISFSTAGSPRLTITSSGKIEVKGTRAGSLQASDDDTLQLYTASTNNNIDRGAGITFYNHDNSGYEMGGTIQVAKENGTADNVAAYMRFSTRPAGGSATERLRIASDGTITTLGTSARSDWITTTLKPSFQIGSGYNPWLSLFKYSNDPYGPYLLLGKTRGTSSTSNTVVQNNDELGNIMFEGTDGSTFRPGARIVANVDGTPGSSDMPTRLSFHTTSDGGNNVTERLRITSGGNIGFNRVNVNAGDSSTQTATANPARFVFNNHYSNGYTDNSLKIYLFNDGATRQGFTSGPLYDLQYHSSGNAVAKHVFYTQNNKDISIEAGQVTKPRTFQFIVETNGTTVSGGWSKLTGLTIDSSNSTGVSNGTYWSNTNQRFTAPVTGTYNFFFGGWGSYSTSTGDRYAVCFRINGGSFKYISGGAYSAVDSPLNGYSINQKLSVNDYVELWYYSAGANTWGGGHRVFWGGYLLG